jgi:hypothetical protein
MSARTLYKSIARPISVVCLFALISLACSFSSGADSSVRRIGRLAQNAPVVDYSQWPLGRLEQALTPPLCASPVPPERMFRIVTPAMAKVAGFGIIDAFIAENAAGTNAPVSCPFSPDNDESTALASAISIFDDSESAKLAYGKYGECMQQDGLDGVSNPSDAELLVHKRYATVVDASSGSGDHDNAAAPVSKILSHKRELKTYERRVAVASASCQAATIAPVAKKLIGVQQGVISSAPNKERKLLGG